MDQKLQLYLSLGLHKGRPSYKRSLQLSIEKHPALQNIKYFFLLLWVIFALLDLDRDPDSEYGSGSTDPIEPIRIRIRNPLGTKLKSSLLRTVYVQVDVMPTLTDKARLLQRNNRTKEKGDSGLPRPFSGIPYRTR